MTAVATLPVLMQKGLHAGRPAASDVGSGALYFCTTHSLIYQQIGGSWGTFWTFSTGFTDPMTSRGDIIIRDASNVTARLAKGGAGTFLGSDGTDVAYANVTDALLSTSDITTNNASTSKHGFLKKLSNSATDYMDGTGNWSTPSGGGGGLSQSYLGYNTVGGSNENLTAKRVYCKKITLSSASVILSVDAHLRPNTDNVDGLFAAVLDDNSNAPGKLLGFSGTFNGGVYLSNSSSMPGAYRWVSMPIGGYYPAGDYWITIQANSTLFTIAYDGSGSDQYFTASLYIATGAYPTAWAITTSANKYSIRANILS